MLVDREIKEALQKRTLIVTHLDNPNQIGPASIDLRIDDKYTYFGTQTKDCVCRLNQHWKDDELITGRVDRYHLLPPKKFGLFSTIEYLTLSEDEDSSLAGRIEGRSSVGRQGLFVHNAGFVDPGFSGQITLELFNATDHTISIEVGTRICQLVLYKTARPNVSYPLRESSKYMYQTGPTPSRMESAKK